MWSVDYRKKRLNVWRQDGYCASHSWDYSSNAGVRYAWFCFVSTSQLLLHDKTCWTRSDENINSSRVSLHKKKLVLTVCVYASDVVDGQQIIATNITWHCNVYQCNERTDIIQQMYSTEHGKKRRTAVRAEEAFLVTVPASFNQTVSKHQRFKRTHIWNENDC